MNQRVAVLTTCFNRREVTLAGLRSLRGAFGDKDYRVYLVDDGSGDGTGDAVRAEFSNVTIIPGDGTLFWNGGMRRAWQVALADRPDYYMWWNDDLQLQPGSVIKLLAEQNALEAKYGGKVIAVGKIVDPLSKVVTYGAYVRSSTISKLSFKRAAGGEEGCTTMNGNCVLIPALAVHDVGILSGRYRHSAGDVDFGLRAVRKGYHIFQSDEPVGFGAANRTLYSDQNSRASFKDIMYVMTHPKAVPLSEWLYFCRSHGGWMWPVNFIYRYLRLFVLNKLKIVN